MNKDISKGWDIVSYNFLHFRLVILMEIPCIERVSFDAFSTSSYGKVLDVSMLSDGAVNVLTLTLMLSSD
jgi:hypothetical protein